MANVTINQLPTAAPLSGSEAAPLWQADQTVQASLSDMVEAGLSDTGVVAGTYGASGASIPNVTVDAQGRITAASNRTLTTSDIGAVPTSREISAGTGLSGGGDLSANRTLSVADTGVSAATYGSSSFVPVVAVNAQGQITSATNTAIDAAAIGAVPTSRTISAGTGLSGGGDLSADRSFAIANTGVSAGSYGSASTAPVLTVNAQGQITSAGSASITPASIGAASLISPAFTALNTSTPNISLTEIGGGNNRSSMVLSSKWQIGVDFGQSGGSDLFFYHSTSGQAPIRVTEDGQPFFVVSHDTVIPDAYVKAPSAILASLVYGRSNNNTTGTGVTVQSTLEIGAVGIPTSGISEFSNYYAMQSVDLSASITGPLNQWSTDYTMITNTTSDGSYAPRFIVGLSQRIHNNAPLQAIGGDFNGAFGGSLVVRPILPGETAEDRTAYRTYPLTAMLQVCGWSGSNRAVDPVNSGAHADADYGALYGLRVGGDGGHVYISNTARSKFEYGAALMDWTHGGLIIDEPHAAFFGPAIRVTQNSGVVTFGKTDASDSSLAANGQLHVGYQGGNIKLYGPGTGVSIRSDINFNGIMLIGSDNTQGGVADFFMYHGPSASVPIYVGASGGVQLYSALLTHTDNTITFPSPPPAEGSATTGQLCVDGSGFLKIKA